MIGPRPLRERIMAIRTRRLTLLHWLAPLLLLGFWALAVASVRNKSNTFDELAHLTTGCSYWLFNDYRLNPENGNLPQRWCALPVVLSGVARLPDVDHPAWRDSNVWTLGDVTFFDLNNPLSTILLLGRAFAALLAVAIAWQVYRWSKGLWGIGGGMVSLVACGLCPTMLAHGPLMTSDISFACFLLGSMTAVWAVLQRVTPARVLACTLLLAGLFLSKPSAGLILGMAGLLIVLRMFYGPPLITAIAGRQWVADRWWRRGLLVLAVGTVCAAGTFTLVWSAYGFRYSAFNTAQLPAGVFYKYGELSQIRGVPERPRAVLAWLDQNRVLPQSYLYGTGFVLGHRNRHAFLLGQYSTTGWLSYFPYCFLLKTSGPLLVLIVLGLWAIWRLGRTRPVLADKPSNSDDPEAPGPLWYRTAPLLVLFFVYGATALMTPLNIGHRHLLPIYPCLYIFVGAVWPALGRGGRLGRVAVALILAWMAVDTGRSFPHYLAYFNGIVPQAQAYRALVDSNLDWGQDLPLLRDWLDEHQRRHGPTPVYLDYFGTSRPSSYGIQATALPPESPQPEFFPWQPGIYAISATNLQAVYRPNSRTWTEAMQRDYHVASVLGERLRRNQDVPADYADPQSPKRRQLLARLRNLQYTRLLNYLRSQEPIDQVGYSILIYQLTEDDLHQAFSSPPAPIHR